MTDRVTLAAFLLMQLRRRDGAPLVSGVEMQNGVLAGEEGAEAGLHAKLFVRPSDSDRWWDVELMMHPRPELWALLNSPTRPRQRQPQQPPNQKVSLTWQVTERLWCAYIDMSPMDNASRAQRTSSLFLPLRVLVPSLAQFARVGSTQRICKWMYVHVHTHACVHHTCVHVHTYFTYICTQKYTSYVHMHTYMC